MCDNLKDMDVIGRLRVIDCSNPDFVLVSCNTCRHRFLVSEDDLLSGKIADCGDPKCKPYSSGLRGTAPVIKNKPPVVRNRDTTAARAAALAKRKMKMAMKPSNKTVK
jgi:hypothetical protein